MGLYSRNGVATLSIDFIVVGGGIAGLACAIGLRRAGHRVLVLEKSPVIGQAVGGYRLPPNLTKILYRWGLEAELAEISVKSSGVDFWLSNTGEYMGSHEWEEEMFHDLQGDYIAAHYSDLQKLLYKAALSSGAQVRLGSHVVFVDGANRMVTLDSGDVLEADMIIGADGRNGVSKSIVVENLTEPKPKWMLYNMTIPIDSMMEDPELCSFCTPQKLHTTHLWSGNHFAAATFLLGGTREFALQLSIKHDQHDDSQGPLTTTAIKECLGDNCDPRLVKLVEMSSPPTCLPSNEYEELEDWVHEDGRVVLVGDAAHPMPAGANQEIATGVEDAALLARLFSRLYSEDQIPIFLLAFQELRQTRCELMHQRALTNMSMLMLPSGSEKDARDEMFRARRDAGVSVFDESTLWTELVETFWYEPEDAADDWWLQWGVWLQRSIGLDIGGLFMPLGNVHVALERAFVPSTPDSTLHDRLELIAL
ncbi:hypothetical protein AX17_006510 [Amanita inopinata Kibby_2008]|nr:hypothetical protein AX17_006510 [Amanita inopinata Kibby_2008]